MNRSLITVPLLIGILILSSGYYYKEVYNRPADAESEEIEISDPLARKLNEEGLRYFESRQFELAEEKFELALTRSPKHPLLVRNLVNTYLSLGNTLGDKNQLDLALAAFEKAIQLRPKYSQTHLGAGWVYLRMDKADPAIMELEEAVRLNPRETEAWLLLGEAYYKKDNSEKALQALNTALSLNPNDENLKKRIADITRDKNVEAGFGKSSSAHFIIKFEGEENLAISQIVGDILEEAYQNIGSVFFARSYQPIIVILYSNQAFHEAAHSPGWASGLYDGKIRVPVQGSEKDTAGLKRVLFHEFTHAVIRQITPDEIPTWLNEGLAMYFEGSPRHSGPEIIEKARQNGTLIPLGNLHGSFLAMNADTASLAYAESDLAVRALIDRYGIRTVRDLLERNHGMAAFSADFEQVFLIPYIDFQKSLLSSASA